MNRGRRGAGPRMPPWQSLAGWISPVAGEPTTLTSQRLLWEAGGLPHDFVAELGRVQRSSHACVTPHPSTLCTSYTHREWRETRASSGSLADGT